VPTAWIGKANRWDYSYFLKSTPHLDESAIKYLSGLGVEFGSHGHSHTDLTGCSDAKLKEELTNSKSIIEDLTSGEITSISYPFGCSDVRVRNAAAEIGYGHGYVMDFPAATDDALAIGRIPVYSYDSNRAVLHKLTGRRSYGLQRLKARLTNRLSRGTILLNKLRGERNP